MDITKASLSNLKEPNSKKITRIGRALHTLISTMTGCSLLLSKPELAGGIYISGAFLQFILDCLPNEDQEIS